MEDKKLLPYIQEFQEKTSDWNLNQPFTKTRLPKYYAAS